MPHACKRAFDSSKTCSIYEDLSECDYNVKPFSASTGWLSRFTKIYIFHNIKMTGEATSADTVKDEVVGPLTPKKYCVLDGSIVFDLHDFFQECTPGVK